MIEFNGSYQQYESYKVYLLCDEFNQIPDNKVGFRIPEGMIVTCDMMKCFFKSCVFEYRNMECVGNVVYIKFYKLSIKNYM